MLCTCVLLHDSQSLSTPVRYDFNFLYICNQLISLVVYITQFMLGVATVRRRGIGTGTKRFISFFIARPTTQTASFSPDAADWFAHRTTSDCRTNQSLSRPDAQSFPKSDSLPVTNSVATPTASDPQRSIPELELLPCFFHLSNGVFPRDRLGNFAHVLPSHFFYSFSGNLIDHSSLFRCRLHWLLRLGGRLSYFPDNSKLPIEVENSSG